MFGYEFAIQRPLFLLLLLLIPVLWMVAWGGVSVAGRFRWIVANGLRSVLFLLVVLALAEVELVRTNDRLTVFYLVDRSLSIPPERLERIIAYVGSSSREFRQPRPEDRVGVITFGGDAAIEVPPWASDLNLPARLESEVDRQQTNLEAALKLAQAAFPPDAAKRVVVITDGQETLGDALATARALAQAGIGIDVVPVVSQARSEVWVEKISTPPSAREKSPFDVQVVLKNQAADHWDREAARQAVSGRIQVVRQGNGHEQVVAEQEIEIPPGTRVFTFQEELPEAGFFSYQVTFTPNDPGADQFSQNNRATSYTHIESAGEVLLIVDSTRPNEFDSLVSLLSEHDLQVTVQPSDQLFTTLAELQRFDLVILANVSRSSGTVDQLSAFSDAQMQMLADNTRNLGAGLMMLGGPDSFGAGGWTNTPIEAALPLDFQIKNAKVVPTGALMLVMDRSGSMAGEKIRWCQAAAIEAVRALGPRDSLGVVTFDSSPTRTVPLQAVGNRQFAQRMISRIAAGGGTDLFPAMEDGFRQLEVSDAAVKHMIVLTDGQTPAGDFARLTRQIRDRKITVSTVAIGGDADRSLLGNIASIGGGKFYQVTSPRAIPRIFMHEARRVSRPLVYEQPGGLLPQVAASHEVLRGIPSNMPPLTGYVMTTPKDSPLVDVLATLPEPVGQANTLLATWQYGLGRGVCWTSDVGQRWTNGWGEWEGRDKLLMQMIRWCMRSTGDTSNFLAATEVDGQKVKVVLNALDEEGNFLNFAAPQLHGVGPESETLSAGLTQVAPGRYEAQFDATRSGAYFLALSPGSGQPPLRLGVNVGYSREFDQRSDNLQMLREMAALAPPGGASGQIFDLDIDEAQLALIDRTPFRHDLPKATSQRPLWYLIMVVCGCLFLLDIAHRRIIWNGAAVAALLARLRKQAVEIEPVPSLGRLKAKKENLNRQWSEEFAPDAFDSGLSSFEPVEPHAPASPAAKSPPQETAAAEEPNYLDRLLQTKQQLRRKNQADDIQP